MSESVIFTETFEESIKRVGKKDYSEISEEVQRASDDTVKLLKSLEKKNPNKEDTITR